MIILWLFEIRTPSLHVTFVSYIYRYIACTTHTIYTIRKLGNLSSGRIEHSPRQRLCVICYHCCVPCDLLPQSLEDKYTIPLYPTSIVVIRGPPEIFMCSRICRKTADDIRLIQIQLIRVRAYSCMLTNITRFFSRHRVCICSLFQRWRPTDWWSWRQLNWNITETKLKQTRNWKFQRDFSHGEPAAWNCLPRNVRHKVKSSYVHGFLIFFFVFFLVLYRTVFLLCVFWSAQHYKFSDSDGKTLSFSYTFFSNDVSKSHESL